MHTRLLSLLLASCYLHAPLEEQTALQPIPTSAPASTPAALLQPPPASAPTTIPVAGRYTARVASLQEECSGMGGLHVGFEILDAQGRVAALAHHGGHGYYPPSPMCRGDLYTVEFTPSEAAKNYANPGWCIFIQDVNGTAQLVHLEKAAPRKLVKFKEGGSMEQCDALY